MATPLRPLDQLITDESADRRRRRLLWTLGSLGVIVVALVSWLVARPGPVPLAAQFEFERLTRGPLTREVVATGRVEARGAVEVGAEVSGRVIAVEVDFDERVEAGQVLLRIDPETFEAQAAQAQAAVAAAEAAVAQAQVTRAEALRWLRQAEALYSEGYESLENYEAARSSAALAEAQLESAQANLRSQRASFEQARTQAERTVIASPIAGVVISRFIDPGQTVVATFQTPVLFVIAEDLQTMEVITPIDEADIAELRVGQLARFTVDAHPNRRFEAVVSEVRNEPKIVQNVVTYDAVLRVANPDLALRPGMTASVRVETARADDVIRVPNAALRFEPPPELAERDPGAEREPGAQGVWVVEGDALRWIGVELGVSSGRESALAAGPLERGDAVIVELSELGRQTAGAG